MLAANGNWGNVGQKGRRRDPLSSISISALFVREEEEEEEGSKVRRAVTTSETVFAQMPGIA